MDRCDVLIVGGGPAGSSCAWKLQRAGLDVVVLDKKSFPRDKVCAGWVTPAVVRTLQLDVESYGRDHVCQQITGFRVGRIGGPDPLEVHYGEPASFGILRNQFDAFLLRRSGARLRLGEPVRSLVRRDGTWTVNDAIEAPMLVGAGGHFCPVARYLGARVGQEIVVAAQEVEFLMSPGQAAHCGVRREMPELYFCGDLSGYGWCFRKGDHLNIGLGREDAQELSGHVRSFLRFLKERQRIPPDVPDHVQGHAYILYGHARRRVVDEGVLLVGDAAGLAYPQSGEGIRTAVESGVLAASAIAGAQQYDQAVLQRYEQRIRERFGKPRESNAWGSLLPDRLKQAIAGTLLRIPWFARHVVLDRWFLHRQEPALSP